MQLQSWLSHNNIEYYQNGNIYTIDGVPYYHVHLVDEKTFDENFNFLIAENELFQIAENDIENIIFLFGSKYYWSNIYKPELNLLKYLGKSQEYNTSIEGFLGIHGKYEILNGTRSYSDWCKKLVFLGYKSAAICEKYTLSGVVDFQKKCKEHDIKSIIGETLLVKDNGYQYYVKLYVENQQGWKELLRLHKIHNIDNQLDPHIYIDDLLSCYYLFVVIHTDTDLHKVDSRIFSELKYYYQLDFTEFKSNQKDKERLNNLQSYLNNFIDKLKPILISDAYYLDSEDYKTKILINEIGKTGFQNISRDQYLKSFRNIYDQALKLFKDQQQCQHVILRATQNINYVSQQCNFEISKTQSYLPKYKFNEDEHNYAKDSHELFMHYITIGFDNKVVKLNKDQDKYFQRLEYEIEVLIKGDVIDYFLILKKDVFDFCKENNVLAGIGRGSSAGSLVAYLLDIVEVDPIVHDLLFERFLNEGRLSKGALADIDSDVPSFFRESIVNHLVTKYGKDNVAFIGTAQLFKLKSLFKDLLKYKGENFQEVNKLTSMISKEDEGERVFNLFQLASQETKLKEALNRNSELVEYIDLLLFQPRSFGIHAAGIIIVPDIDGQTIYDCIPMRYDDGNLITEWEKDTLEDQGFLKLDLLGLTQLDKIIKICSLIKQNHNVDIDILKIDLNDPKVFELFQKGYTEDIFQFGTQGLKQYCKELKPETINDLIAANALYRPGAMDSGMHKKYIRVKNNQELPTYDIGTYEATKDTYGIAIFQEQIMKIFADVGGFSLVEADDVRKYMGKKDKEALDKSKVRFIQGGLQKGFLEDDLNLLWGKLETFSRYGFNRSHSAAYSITGYYTQWLKCYYPIEFYSVALEFSSEESIGNIISEINYQKHIQLQHPNINKSLSGFSTDVHSIYWGFLSIKYVGEKAISKIIKERNNGVFYSLSEFLQRCGSFLDKRVLTNLILTGCFDELENIKPNDLNSRAMLLSQCLDDNVVQKVLQENKLLTSIDFTLKQKELCGYGFIDFRKPNTVQIDELTEHDVERFISIYALVDEIREFNTKNGVMGRISLSQNGKRIHSVLWNDCYCKYKDILKKSVKKPIFFNGIVKKDHRSGNLGLQSTKFSQIIF